MDIILVRHGETEWNKLGLCQGISDICLSSLGKKQAELLATSLKDDEIQYIYSSNLKRAYETAKTIAKFHDTEVRIDPGFREMDQGIFEGVPFLELRETRGDLLRSWRADPENFRIPNGETLTEVQQRAYMSVDTVIKAHSPSTVLIVTHNFTIITLLCKFLGENLSEFYKFKIKETSKHVISLKNGITNIKIFNNTEHLSGLV